MLYCVWLKGQFLPYSLLSVGPRADPGVHAVSPQLKLSSDGRLPLLSTRPAVTFPVEERHRRSTSTKLYCFVTEAPKCEELAQGCYAALSELELNPYMTRASNGSWSKSLTQLAKSIIGFKFEHQLFSLDPWPIDRNSNGLPLSHHAYVLGGVIYIFVCPILHLWYVM